MNMLSLIQNRHLIRSDVGQILFKQGLSSDLVKRLISVQLCHTGKEIEDVHIFGGQTPVKRLENLNVCRENEFFSQLLNDQIKGPYPRKISRPPLGYFGSHLV